MSPTFDCERACALLIGRVLNAVAHGNANSTDDEKQTVGLLKDSPIFKNGLHADYETTSQYWLYL